MDMIIHLHIKPSSLMDNKPRVAYGQIKQDETYSLSANVSTEEYRLEWADDKEVVIKLTKINPTK
jgi:hypothetical protein